ncbi:MAG: peptidoglycan bridge formation glycyltransferase FemA/FemB family protein [Pseudomonadota bacterium]
MGSTAAARRPSEPIEDAADRAPPRPLQTTVAPPTADPDDPVAAEWVDGPDDLAADFRAACAGAPYAAYQQSYAYGEAIRAMGGRVLRARIVQGDAVIGVAQAVTHRLFGGLAVTHVMRGPVWRDPAPTARVKAAAVGALHKTLPAKGLCALLISPEGGADDGLAEAGFKRVFSGYHTALLDLTAPEDALLKGLNGKWRNRLRAAQTSDVVATRLGRDPSKYAWLLDKDAQLMHRLRHQSSNVALIPQYQERAGRKSVLGFEAKRGAARLAGMLFLRHGEDATYHIGWSGEDGKALNAHNLLLWEAVLELKKSGVRTLDLGGIDTDNNPGIARFKLGVGGAVVSLPGSWTKGPRWR